MGRTLMIDVGSFISILNCEHSRSDLTENRERLDRVPRIGSADIPTDNLLLRPGSSCTSVPLIYQETHLGARTLLPETSSEEAVKCKPAVTSKRSDETHLPRQLGNGTSGLQPLDAPPPASLNSLSFAVVSIRFINLMWNYTTQA